MGKNSTHLVKTLPSLMVIRLVEEDIERFLFVLSSCNHMIKNHVTFWMEAPNIKSILF